MRISFSLDFPFELKTLESEGLGSVVVERDADQGISRLLDTLGGPFAALTEISGITGVSEERLEDIIDASPRWEFLDPERRYFWKRPRLPPTNFRLTGNPVLNCICKIFSVARVVRTADLTRSIIRERSWRQDDAVLHVPASVLEGVAEGSGLFEVGDGYISRKGGIEWCTVGRRDVALLRACVEYGRVVSSRELYSWLVRCGLTEENANITVAYSPFLVHTRSGVGTKEGIYRFVVDQEHLDLDGPCQQVVESDDDQSSSDAEEFNDGKDGYQRGSRLVIRISSRTLIFGTFFASDIVGLDGDWKVVDGGGGCIGTITIFRPRSERALFCHRGATAIKGGRAGIEVAKGRGICGRCMKGGGERIIEFRIAASVGTNDTWPEPLPRRSLHGGGARYWDSDSALVGRARLKWRRAVPGSP